MKHRVLLISIIGVAMGSLFMQPVYALDKKALGDSLTVYANRFARVGKVKVEKVRVNQDRADIYTNPTLGYLSLTQEQIDTFRLIASKAIYGDQGGECYIHIKDGYELSELLAEKLRKDIHYTLPPQRHPLVSNSSRQYKADRGLDGFHIALYGSHGLYYNQKDQRWTFQRARLLTTVEDLYTTSYTMTFLVPMLENAGAVVIQPRERDTQLNEVIADDEAKGAWQYADGGFAIPTEPLTEGVNPFAPGGYSYSKAETEKSNVSTMEYHPQIEEEGDYAVYVSYKTLPNSTNAAQYTVVHNGVKTDYTVNQKMSGGTWVYIGTFFFSTDRERNYVSLSNYGKGGTMVSADAVKFGGGMGSVARYAQPEAIDNIKSSSEEVQSLALTTDTTTVVDLSSAETSGFPRYIEGARYWMQYSGIPDSVYNYTKSKNDYVDDYAARGCWINWLIGGSAAYPQGKGLSIPIHLGLAFHSDAGLTMNDSIVGTLAIYLDKDNDKQTVYPTGISRLAARNYTDMVQTQIVNDIRATFAPEWQRRQLMNSSYAEARHPKTPTMLLELLSHQNPADMKYGLDPRFRFIVSRAIYKGMLRYLHEQYGSRYVVQPLPVRQFAIRQYGSDSLCLSWEETVDTLEITARPDNYIVYTRKAGEDWDNGTKTDNNRYYFVPEKDIQYDFRIAAANHGGQSFPSETLSARISSTDNKRILIVNGFNRISAPEYFQTDSVSFGFTTEAVPYGKEVNFIGRQYEYGWAKTWVSDDDGGFGSSFMDHADCWYQGNTFDYPSLHGKALAAQGYSFVSCSADALKNIPEDIDAVDLILGKQKQVSIGSAKQTIDFATFTPDMRNMLTEYISKGGRFLTSGAYITSDQAADKDFLQNTLHIKQASRRATKSGKITVRIPHNETTQAVLLTEPNTRTLHCEVTDGIVPADKESMAVARFKDSFIAAGVAHSDSESNAKTVVFSFPLESLNNFEETYLPAIKWVLE